MAGENGNSATKIDVDPFELLAIAGSLNSTLDLDFLLKKIGIASEQLLDCEASSIMLVDQTKKFLYFKVATGTKGAALKKITVPIGKGIAGWVAEHREQLIVNDTSKDERFTGQVDKSSGFQTRSIMAIPMVTRGELIGVAEVLNKRGDGGFTESDVNVFTSLSSLASVAIANTKLIQDQKNFFSHVLELMANAIESTSPKLHNSPQFTSQLVCVIARYMELSREEYQFLYYAGLLANVGNIGMKIPRVLEELGMDSISDKDGPIVSSKMLDGINMLWGSIPIIKHYRERFDGSGFPDKLEGEKIPLGARILGLVAAMEDFRISSGLRGPDLKKKAAQEAKNGAGNRFDPKVVEAWLQILEQEDRIWA